MKDHADYAKFIFHFNDEKAPQARDEDTCRELYKHFWDTIEQSECTRIPWLRIPVRASGDFLEDRTQWFPANGFAVLFKRLTSIEAHVLVVVLNKWETKIHSSVHGRESIMVPDVSLPVIICLGPIEVSSIETKMQLFRSEWSGSKTPKDHPVNVLAQIMRQRQTTGSILDMKYSLASVRDFESCNLSFPLVLGVAHAILHYNSDRSGHDFNKYKVLYFFSFLPTLVDEVKIYDARKIDKCVHVVRELVAVLQRVKEDKKFQKYIMKKVEKYTEQLESIPYDRGENLTLPKETVKESCKNLRNPKLPDRPVLQYSCDDAVRLASARADALKNLNFSKLRYDKIAFNGNAQDLWIQLGLHNTFFWDSSCRLQSDISENVEIFLERLSQLAQIVDSLREKCCFSPNVMKSVLLSYKMLAAWIAFCWAHKAAERSIECFRMDYGPALHPDDLQHLILDDRSATEAAERVKSYLQSRMQQAWFPFRHSKATLRLASQYGALSSEYKAIYEGEQKAAKRSIKERWIKISKIQSTLSKLDIDLETAKRHLEDARMKFERSQARDYHLCDNGGKSISLHTLKSRRNSKRRKEKFFI